MTADLAYVLRDYTLTNTARVIWGYLYSLSKASEKQGKPFVFVGYRKIAERVGVCEKTVYSAMKQLKTVGLIAVKRRGQGLNSQTYVFSPSMPQKERETKENCVSSYGSRHVKKPSPIIKNKSVNYQDGKTIYPSNSFDNAPMAQDFQGYTKPKGKPTNKRPRINIEKRQILKAKYKEYLYNSLKMDDFKKDMLSNGDEIEALEKSIELISNTMACNGKIMVNNTLLLPIQWWSIIKSISREAIINLIYRLRTAKNVKNPRAYFLSALYNTAIQESMVKPWYDTGY